MQSGKFNVIMDLQYGSCGKGKFTDTLTRKYRVTDLSGSNRPNAGHTVQRGQTRQVFKVLPSGANNHISCWLSPASMFMPERLIHEWVQADHPFLRIHGGAQILQPSDVREEAVVIGSIASTNQGSLTGLLHKLARTTDNERFAEHNVKLGHFTKLTAEGWINTVYKRIQAGTWLHECSQGWWLSLDHGMYPYVTSRNCGSAAALDQMGVDPHMLGDVYGVFRPYPIRVGNVPGQHSGPCRGKEIQWADVAQKAGMSDEQLTALVSTEHTTVTGRPRRVFAFSFEEITTAVRANGVTKLLLNFAQYMDIGAEGVLNWTELPTRVRNFIDLVEAACSIPVIAVGTGPDTAQVCWRL